MTKRDSILGWHDFDAFTGFDQARDEHAARIRKALADAGLPRPNPDYEDYGDDEIMARLGQWLDLYDGVMRCREAGDISEMAWRLERMGEIRGELVWRYNVQWTLGLPPEFTPDDAVAFKQQNMRTVDARHAARDVVNKQRSKVARAWNREAQREAEKIWERRPELRNSLSATAAVVRKNLGWSRPANTIRRVIKKT